MLTEPVRRAPAGLKSDGKALWRATTLRFDLDPHELPTLAEACRLADELAQLRAALRDDGRALVTGSSGQDVPNPLYGEIRSHGALIHRLMASLGVEGTAAAGQARSQNARRAARARWDH